MHMHLRGPIGITSSNAIFFWTKLKMLSFVHVLTIDFWLCSCVVIAFFKKFLLGWLLADDDELVVSHWLQFSYIRMIEAWFNWLQRLCAVKHHLFDTLLYGKITLFKFQENYSNWPYANEHITPAFQICSTIFYKKKTIVTKRHVHFVQGFYHTCIWLVNAYFLWQVVTGQFVWGCQNFFEFLQYIQWH